MKNCVFEKNVVILCVFTLLFDILNYITLILVILLVLGISDFFTEPFPGIQRQVYNIAFFVTAFLFTIKYYYGPDITSYVPHYENIPTVSQLIANDYDLQFESGYNFFCSVLKHAGISFYWMTAIISVFYFAVIWFFFKRIKRKKSFALMILVLLDYKLIFATYRQCMSVALFLVMVMLLENRHFLWALVMGVLAASFHKAGVFVVALSLLFYVFRTHKMKTYIYELLFLLLMMVLIMPLADIGAPIIRMLPIPSDYADSIIHHLTLGKKFQSVFIIYAMVILCIAHYMHYGKDKMSTIGIIAIVGLLFVISMYQYYYLLNRMRSYFLPVVIVFVFRLVQNVEDEKISVQYGNLLKQITSVLIVLYLSYSTYTFHKGVANLHNNIYAACTVFDLRNGADKKAIQHRQMELAERYWKEDFMKNENNKLSN